MQQNGYFQLVKMTGGFGVKCFPPTGVGEQIPVMELADYLDNENISYDLQELKETIERSASGGGSTLFLGTGECPVCHERYKLAIADDSMTASVRFYSPSETGSTITMDEFFKDIRSRGILSGLQLTVVATQFKGGRTYCTDIAVAKGKEPRHGTDARVEYSFNTDVHIQPTMREDGSVDYYHLNMINQCKKGDVLARIIPEDPGEPGMNVLGGRIRQRSVKRASLHFGNNITLSEDKSFITSDVDGHVTLVEGKVFVSDVYEVEDVGLSTGDIDFQGSVQVNGNVAANFNIQAGGNVIIKGVAEGARITAGGNIIIARGMNGMSKGLLKAGGNVIAKFLENCTVEARGYVNTESILHSNVSAGTEIQVTGRRGFITGGRVRAVNRVTAKNLGSDMGAVATVEVGVRPEIKNRFLELQKETGELVKEIRNAQNVIQNFAEKKSKGARFLEDQIKFVRTTAAALEVNKSKLQEYNEEMRRIQEIMGEQNRAEVIVKGVVYAGTTITIGDVSMTLKSNNTYCRFEKVEGDVKSTPL